MLRSLKASCSHDTLIAEFMKECLHQDEKADDMEEAGAAHSGSGNGASSSECDDVLGTVTPPLLFSTVHSHGDHSPSSSTKEYEVIT